MGGAATGGLTVGGLTMGGGGSAGLGWAEAVPAQAATPSMRKRNGRNDDMWNPRSPVSQTDSFGASLSRERRTEKPGP